MKLLRPAILVAMLALSCPLHAETIAAPALPSSDVASVEHRTAVRSVLEGFHLGLMARNGMKKAGPADSIMREVMVHMEQHVSDDEIYTRLTPLYLKYFSTEEATQLASFLRSDVGQRYMIAVLSNRGAMQGDKDPHFTDKELLELKRGIALPAWIKMGQANEHIGPEMGQMVRAWNAQYYARLSAQSNASLRAFVSAWRNKQPGEPEPVLALSGISNLDEVELLTADFIPAMYKLNHAYTSDLASYGLAVSLSPERLVSAEGIAISKETVAKASERVELYLAEADKLLQKMQHGVLASKLDQANTESFKKSLTYTYGAMLRLAENQRHLLDLFTRTLRLAESRLGTIQLKGEKLIFQDEADMKMYQSLVEQMQKAAAEEAALGVDAKEVEQRHSSKLGI